MSRKTSMTHKWYFTRDSDADSHREWPASVACAKCGRGAYLSTVLLVGECWSRIDDIDWDRPFDVEHFRLKSARGTSHD